MEIYTLEVQVQRENDTFIVVRWNQKVHPYSRLGRTLQVGFENINGVERVSMYNYYAHIDWVDWVTEYNIITADIVKVFDDLLDLFYTDVSKGSYEEDDKVKKILDAEVI